MSISSASLRKIFHQNEQIGIAYLDSAFYKNQTIMKPVHQLYSRFIEVYSMIQLNSSL